jgi:hypothetical protein
MHGSVAIDSSGNVRASIGAAPDPFVGIAAPNINLVSFATKNITSGTRP